MHIFFLSVTDNLEPELRERLANEIKKRGNTVAYISSQPQDNERVYFRSTLLDYTQISSDIHMEYFDLSSNFSDEALAKLLDFGTIYLSGGNTFAFMNDSRQRNLIPILKKHLTNGGLLVGASAGSIMMTPTIELAKFGDENTVGLRDLSGFGFVNFEFQPHYEEDQKGEYLISHMQGKTTTLYTCKDHSGLFYSDGEITVFGDTQKYVHTPST